MSGPKCIEIRIDPRVAERERNIRECGVLGAEYTRLETRFRQLTPEIKKVGLKTPEIPGKDAIDRKISDYLARDRDSEAVDYLRRECGDLQAAITTIEQQINDAHARALTSKLLGHIGPGQSLDETLQALAKTGEASKRTRVIDEKVDSVVAKIVALREMPGWSSLIEKAEEIRGETDKNRRQMLYDDLIIKCSKELKQLREVARWGAEIDGMIDRIAHLRGTEKGDGLLSELRDIKRGGHVGPLASVRLRMTQTIEAEERRLEREKKKRAILESLHDLGYEANEGMETAFVQSGRLVLRKPDDGEYAVEVATNDDFSLLQTTMLRYADSLDASQQQRLRDTAKEEAWCDDHAKLLDGLAKRGWKTNFKMKRKPGEIPMQVVIDEGKVYARRRAAAPSERSQSASRGGGN
jgi:hypothetical protein